MIEATTTLKDLFLNNYRQVILIESTDGELTITEEDVIANTLSVERSCVAGGYLQVGSVSSAELSFMLRNDDGKYDDVQFEGKTITLKIGSQKWDALRWEKAQMEYIPYGVYVIDTPPRKSKTISIQALDLMSTLDIPYITELGYPTFVENILEEIGERLNLTFAFERSNALNWGYMIGELPSITGLTFRTVLRWLCEIMGTCAYMDGLGQLVMKWYTPVDVTITPSNRFDLTIDEQPIRMDGVILENSRGKYSVGVGTYALHIQGNELIQLLPQTVADRLYDRVNGFTYTPANLNVLPMPYLEPLDVVNVEYKGVLRPVAITGIQYKLNGRTYIESIGKTMTNKRTANLPIWTFSQISDFQRAIRIAQQTTGALANALGVYTTAKPGLNTGGIELYIHDSKELEDSTYICKSTEIGDFAWTDKGWQATETVWTKGINATLTEKLFTKSST